MSAPLYPTEAVAWARWVRAGATGDELARLAAEHAALSPHQRADLAREIATCSDGDLAALLDRRRESTPRHAAATVAGPVSARKAPPSKPTADH